METHNQMFMKLLDNCIEETINEGDIDLTIDIMNDSVLLVRLEDNPICFCIGWDSQEKFNVFSLN